MSEAREARSEGSGQPGWIRLRRCLGFEPVPEKGQPFPSLVITDPVCGRYYKAGWPASGMLMLWNEAGSFEALAAAMRSQFGTVITEDDFTRTKAFVTRSELGEADDRADWQRLRQGSGTDKSSLLKRLAHNYLFFRIPLFQPDRFLKRLLPVVSFVFSRRFWIILACVWAVGLYLSTRQWSAVVDAAAQALRFEQVFLFAAALFVLKGVHEMGHALTTVHYGCRVHSMGIAFMLGTPMLYTDTSDSWRLASDRQRLAIAFGGVAAECIVAAFAILAWPLLPEGSLRQICFSFAGTAIAMSLLVNLNPLMRFDGYFALSDVWQIPNLQNRSFELATWSLREFLFGLSAPPPESLAPNTRRKLIIYAYCVWVYRFFLYLGIAYLVYVMAGKAMGIVLGLFELAVFIIRPVWHELQAWWNMRDGLRGSMRARITAGLAGCGLLLLCTPCFTTVESPGVLVAVEEQEIHLPSPARLTAVSVKPGQLVQAGEVLFEAESTVLNHELRTAALKVHLIGLRLSRIAASPDDQEQAVVLKREFNAALEKYRGIERSRQKLRVVAPFAGRVSDVDKALAPGTWVSEAHVLARVTGTNGARVKAMVADADVARIAPGALGVFVADEADLASRAVTLERIAPASDGKLTEAALGDVNGGPIASSRKDHELKVRDGWVEVTYIALGAQAPVRVIRGVVQVDCEPYSPLSAIWRRIGAVLVREQAF